MELAPDFTGLESHHDKQFQEQSEVLKQRSGMKTPISLSEIRISI